MCNLISSLRVDGPASCKGSRCICIVLAVVLVFALQPAMSATAYAEVRKADVVTGQTVEERDLSISQCPDINAEFAALATEDGEVFFARDGQEHTQIASITKVMTAIVALDNAPSDLSVEVSQKAAEIGESSANLQEGDVLDLESALKALLVPSGNDAAIALAEAVGAIIAPGSDDDEAIEAFVSAMNDKARDLGMNDTVYENPHGLDDGEYAGDLHSTALDQLKVAQCAMQHQVIRSIVGGGSTAISVKRNGEKETIDLESTDLLLDMYDEAIGIKTGVTNLAGPSFMGAAEKDGREFYAVVLNSSDEYTRFEDAQSLFEWGYEHIVDVPVANTAQWANMRFNGENTSVPVIAEVSHQEWIDKTVKATLANPEMSVTVFDLEGNVTQELAFEEIHGSVSVGDKVGTITLYQRNKAIAKEDLVACEYVEAPNPIDTIAIWWQRVTQGLSGDAAHASSKINNVMPIIYDHTSSAA